MLKNLPFSVFVFYIESILKPTYFLIMQVRFLPGVNVELTDNVDFSAHCY